jgi:hypothetical protein
VSVYVNRFTGHKTHCSQIPEVITRLWSNNGVWKPHHEGGAGRQQRQDSLQGSQRQQRWGSDDRAAEAAAPRDALEPGGIRTSHALGHALLLLPLQLLALLQRLCPLLWTLLSLLVAVVPSSITTDGCCRWRNVCTRDCRGCTLRSCSRVGCCCWLRLGRMLCSRGIALLWLLWFASHKVGVHGLCGPCCAGIISSE